MKKLLIGGVVIAGLLLNGYLSANLSIGGADPTDPSPRVEVPSTDADRRDEVSSASDRQHEEARSDGTLPIERRPERTPTFDQAGYLANLSHDPFLEKYSDDALLLLAEAACSAMPGAEDLQPARDAVGSIVTDPDSVSLVVWTALPMRCPEYEPLVEVDLGGVENPVAAPEGEPRATYLSSLRALPWYAGLTDEILIMQGQTICDGFTRGDSLAQTMIYFEPYPRDAAELAIQSAVQHMCPEHEDRLN